MASSASPGDAAQHSVPQRRDAAIVFAGFRLQPDGSLFRGDALIHLPPRELAALRLLLAHAGQIVTSTQFKEALWGGVHVTAESIPRCLSTLRAHLRPNDCVQTVYKRGYRLVAEVRRLDDSGGHKLARLAILPFATGRGVDLHLGAAIADETIARLSNAREPLASMVARDSVFTLAARGLTAQQTGQALHADLVMAGSLQAFVSHLRLRVEMIRVSDGIQIWAEDLLVGSNGIAALESDLAARLDFRLQSSPLQPRQEGGHFSFSATHTATEALETLSRPDEKRPTPTGAERSAARSSWGADGLSIAAAAGPAVAAARVSAPRFGPLSGPISVSGPVKSARSEAYEIFLRGHYEGQTIERHRMQDGLQHLARAIDLDPSLVAAKVDMVRLCAIQAVFGYMPPAVARDLARRTAETIPEHHADPVLPALGSFSFHVDFDLPAALHAFSNSAHLPHDASVTRSRVMFSLSRGRFDEGIAQIDAALQLDPFAPWLHARRAWALHLAGRHPESMAQMRHCLELFPDHEGVALYGAIILTYNGDAASGLRLAEALSARMPYYDQIIAIHAYALACANRKPEARALISRLRWLGQERFVSSSFNAAVYVALGDMDNALAELKSSMDMRCPWFFQMLADPRLEPLHGREDFEELRSVLTRMETSAADSALSDELASVDFRSTGL
jgi:DNA-binding winged helix-turn-helix (wHTH) protein/tetratricopeptide (TPR) repeat protein